MSETLANQFIVQQIISTDRHDKSHCANVTVAICSESETTFKIMHHVNV